jgi:hypothetical protein
MIITIVSLHPLQSNILMYRHTQFYWHIYHRRLCEYYVLMSGISIAELRQEEIATCVYEEQCKL